MKKIVKISFLSIFLILLSSCSNQSKLLNPDKPITITVWHYYNGLIKEKFDSLVLEFNETIGTEKGIIVEPQSYGEVIQLETALLDSAEKAIGSSPLLDIFAAYSDHAFQMAKLVNLVPLEKYFTKEELAAYREEFLQEGRFLKDGKSYILPVAKSTENLYVNKKDWDKFRVSYGFTNDDLSTWEGILRVSEKYYEETGKSFFALDSNANFMFLFTKQFGDHFFSVNPDGQAKFTMTEETGRAIWQTFYKPFIQGHFNKMGCCSASYVRFRLFKNDQ